MTILLMLTAGILALLGVSLHLQVLAIVGIITAYIAGHFQGKEWERMKHASEYACEKFDDLIKELKEEL